MFTRSQSKSLCETTIVALACSNKHNLRSRNKERVSPAVVSTTTTSRPTTPMKAVKHSYHTRSRGSVAQL
jgi:hypothetical protein